MPAMRSQPGIWVISSSRPRAPVRMVTMRKAAEDMAARLAEHLCGGPPLPT